MSATNFEEQQQIVDQWLETHPNVQLILADETESSFQFASTLSNLSSFVVICPSSEPTKWNVRTDVDSVHAKLSQARDYCRSSSGGIKRISELLDLIIPPDTSDEEDEMDENEDAYDEGGDDMFYDDSCVPEDDETKPRISSPENSNTKDEEDMKWFTGAGSPMAVQRLITDLKTLKRSEGKYGISGNPRDDNLFIWDVQLMDFPEKSQLGQDLAYYAKKYNQQPVIDMEMIFPNEYPMRPPFVRVIRPRFKFLTGHVTIGGSICMEALTMSGWSPGNDIESILVQIRATIISDDGASLDTRNSSPYTESEARDAFKRMAARYNWKL